MAAIFTQKFTSAVTNPTAQALVENEWSLGLQGLTAEQVLHGVERARTECDWPPSISEFINLALDIPSQSEFIAEINAALSRSDMSSKLISTALVVTRTSSWDLQQMGMDALGFWKRDAYPLVVERLRTERML